ncbi:MAG: hypothetical protein IT521_05475 [Burkholderiales bacterium]|nr:hypothetical protein [Burkholderiales bacterium]
MDDRFSAYSFVDRITTLEPGLRACGSFAIPSDIDAFPPSLMGEAVGQLAAWAAMAHIGFRQRPVAALARDTRFLRVAHPGDVLDLTVDIESINDEAVSFRGFAEIQGQRAIEMNDYLGPLLPVEDFDDPAALSTRFDLLRGAGAPPGRYRGIVRPRVTRDGGEHGESARGTLHVPAAARFFNDHFPRRPVFPATLLLDAQIDFALQLAAESPFWPAGSVLVPVRLTNVKVRAFTLPGQALTIAAELRPPKEGTRVCTLTAQAEGKQVATARVEIAARNST